MSHVEALSQWKKTVSTYFGHLSGPQARGLALWSFGMVLAKSCGITSVVGLLAPLVENSESNVRQHLREWCYDAKDKKGEHRQQIDLSLCFAPLLCWLLSWWTVDERRLALAMDASNLSDRFTVLCISVVYRGCAIPVAWKILVENAPGSWEPYWKDLFTLIHSSVPAGWTVIVLADRGLYAKWLYEHLVSLGWHPFLRINVRGKVRPEGEEAFRWLSSLVPVAGSAWAGAVECFVDKPKRLSCTLLACYEAGYADPWLIVTDLPASAANVVWYSMRSWIEAGFKDTKRGGWQWHQTKMSDPARASRLWLAIAVASFSFACFVLRMITAQFHRESIVADLAELADKSELLSGLLPICAACKMIRDHEVRDAVFAEHLRGLAQSRASALRSVHPGTLAGSPCPRQETESHGFKKQRQEQEKEGEEQGHSSTFQSGCMKNLPVKAGVGWCGAGTLTVALRWGCGRITECLWSRLCCPVGSQPTNICLGNAHLPP